MVGDGRPTGDQELGAWEGGRCAGALELGAGLTGGR